MTTRKNKNVSYTYGMYHTKSNNKTNVYYLIASAVIIGLVFITIIFI